MKPALLERLQQARAEKHPAAVVSALADGRQSLVLGDDCQGELTLSSGQRETVQAAIVADRSGMLAGSDPAEALFCRVYNPPLRLIIIGAVHISQRLAPMAVLAGYQVILVDPRKAWASPERFPDTQIDDRWPDQALEALAPDHRTAIAALTHDPKLDDPALLVALRSPAFYVGGLGSKKTQAARRERLTEAGLDEAALARIHGPIGLDIKARSPAEIAIAILAEITQVRNRA